MTEFLKSVGVVVVALAAYDLIVKRAIASVAK